MKVDVVRYGFGADCTLGLLLIDGIFHCYTLEDEVRTKKVYGETCIPEGKYILGLKVFGSMHDRYLARYGNDFHKGMIEVMGVPGFSDILIHVGNDDDDTAGCLLVGYTTVMPKRNFVGYSRMAYEAVYPIIMQGILDAGDNVMIEYRNINFNFVIS